MVLRETDGDGDGPWRNLNELGCGEEVDAVGQ